MKITDVECTMLRLPEVRPIADGTQDTLIVQVHTDAGITGIGEAHTSPWVLKAVIEAPMSHVMARGLREIVLGEDPLDIRRIWDKMYATTSVFGRRGAVLHAMSAIDIALWDIFGKVVEQPVWRLLGGAYRDRIPAYASILALDTPEASVQRARELADQGYRAVKFGWNGVGTNVEQDIATLQDVRTEVGPDMDLMLDVGAPMPIGDATKLARGLEAVGVRFLEEPLSPDDLDGYAALGAATTLPIAAGEKETTRFGFRDLLERARLSVIQPDVARAGGLTECRRIADLAALHGATVIPHCWSTDILVAATLHLIASLEACPYLEYCLVDNPIRMSVTRNHITPEDGYVAIPDRPGLGIELDFDTIDRYRYTPA